MTNNRAMKSGATGSQSLTVGGAITRVVLSAGLLCAFIPAATADKLSCLPPQRLSESPSPAPANKKIGVSVAYLKVPFYANFKTGLEDGAKQFGFTYDLVDGNSGDVATELANLQNFLAQKEDLILLTPSGDGIIPALSSSMTLKFR